MEREKQRSNVKELTREVLSILWEQTDKEHSISIQKLIDILEARCDSKPDRKTVSSVLNILRDHPCGPGTVKCRETEKAGETGKQAGYSYAYGYYMDRDLTAEEVEMLINDVMFSRMRTQAQAKTFIEKLKGLVSIDRRKKLEYACVLPYSLYTVNKLVQKNIPYVQRVISENLHQRDTETVIGFHFNGYGSDKKIHEVPNGRYHNFLPLKIVEAYGSYYMIGLMDGKPTPWNFRLDLITRLDSAKRPRPQSEQRAQAIQKLSDPGELSDYLTEHLYMGYETKMDKPIPVYLRVKKIPWKQEASLTIVHDAFGQNYTVMFENDQYVDIRVTGILWGITGFVRQNMDRVRVTGDEKAKELVEDALRKDFENYFCVEE